MRTFGRIALACGLCLLSAGAGAEVYRWTDAEGRVHFGDRPPEGAGEAVPLRAPPAAPETTPEDRLEKQRRLLRAFDEERRQQRDAREQRERDAAERQRYCAKARDDLHNHESAGALYRLGPDGQRVFLSDAEREGAIAQARAAVVQWCGKT